MELVKGSAHALVYETGLLIGHTHILFYFIFQLLVQKHKISTIKGVSFICATDVDNLGCPCHHYHHESHHDYHDYHH